MILSLESFYIRDMAIRILLVDDHKIVREGLRSLIKKQSDMDVVSEADNGRTTVCLAQKLHPDIIIMDIGLPDINGIEATRKIIDTVPDTRIIALSMYSEVEFVMDMLNAGAMGYLLKDSAFHELARAIRIVHANHIYMSQKITEVIAQDLLNHLLDRDPGQYALPENQEGKVLQSLAEGQSTEQIASSLSISREGVERYRQNILNKWILINNSRMT